MSKRESPEQSRLAMDTLLAGEAYASNNKALYLYYRQGIANALKEAYDAISKEDAIPVEDRLALALHATNYRLNGRPLPGFFPDSYLWSFGGVGAVMRKTWQQMLDNPFRFYKAVRIETIWKYQEAVSALDSRN